MQRLIPRICDHAVDAHAFGDMQRFSLLDAGDDYGVAVVDRDLVAGHACGEFAFISRLDPPAPKADNEG